MTVPAGDVTALFEREGDLATIDRALSATFSGEGTVLAVEGPAGIGKSRLLEVLVDQARAGQARVVRARGGALERDFAFGVARQLLERTVVEATPEARAELLGGAAGMAGSVLGVGESGHAVDVSYTVMHGLYWLVANLADEGPLVLVVDDLHWSDGPSIRFLAHLAPRLDGLPVLLALGLRTGEPDTAPLIDDLCTGPGTVAIRPEPLTAAAVHQVLAEAFGTEPAPEFTQASHTTSGGNPFLLGELTHALVADGVQPDQANAALVSRLGPETLSRALLLRLTRLPAGADKLAAAVAVLGTDVELRHAAALAGLGIDEAGTVADSLASVQILGPGRPLEFVHPIVREAIHADLSPSERTNLHRKAAGQLSDAGAPPDLIAPHLLATEPADDPNVVTTLRGAAGSVLERGAAETAQRYLRRALAECGPDPDLLAELGSAEWLANEEPEAAIAHLRASLDATEEPALRALRAVVLARVTFGAGDVPAALKLIEDELDRSGDALPPEILTRLQAERGGIALLAPPMSPQAIDELEDYVDLPGDTAGELLILTNLSAKRWLTESADQAAGMAERALAGGRLVAAESSDSIPVYQAIWVLAYADRHDAARAALEVTLADAKARGSIFGISCSHVMRAVVAWRAGDVLACEAEARGAIDVGQVPEFAAPLAWTCLILALLERGAIDEAAQAAADAGLGPGIPNLVPTNPVFFSLGRLAMAQGKPEEALEAFEEQGRRDESLGQRNPGLPWRAGAVDALRALGRYDEAKVLADEQLVLARHWSTSSSLGMALRTAGLAHRDLSMLQKSVEVLGDSPARLNRARALVELGSALRRAGRRKDAREPLREGLDLARRLGATVLVETAHEELVTAGAKPRRLMFSGVESLTAAERRVALMAAEDMTNRDIAQALFVTAKTVENHLSRCYSKLAITSRAELAGALAEVAPTS